MFGVFRFEVFVLMFVLLRLADWLCGLWVLRVWGVALVGSFGFGIWVFVGFVVMMRFGVGWFCLGVWCSFYLF